MGAVHSRQCYHDVACDDLHAAQDVRQEVGQPRVQGAIMTYANGRIDARHPTHDYTNLEVSFLSHSRKSRPPRADYHSF